MDHSSFHNPPQNGSASNGAKNDNGAYVRSNAQPTTGPSVQYSINSLPVNATSVTADNLLGHQHVPQHSVHRQHVTNVPNGPSSRDPPGQTMNMNQAVGPDGSLGRGGGHTSSNSMIPYPSNALSGLSHDQHVNRSQSSWAVPNPLVSMSVGQRNPHHISNHIPQLVNTNRSTNVAQSQVRQHTMSAQGTHSGPGRSDQLQMQQLTRQNLPPSHHQQAQQLQQQQQILQHQQHQQQLLQQQQQRLQQQQHHLLQQQLSQQQAQQLQQQQAQQQHPTPATSGTATKVDKPKIMLTQDSKKILAKAIWSALKSPTGEVDPPLMQAALQTGLPHHVILNAVRVSRQRDAAKREENKLKYLQQLHHQAEQAQASASAGTGVASFTTQSTPSHQQVNQASQSSVTVLSQQQQLQQRQQTVPQKQLQQQLQKQSHLQQVSQDAAVLAQKQKQLQEKQMQQQQKKIQLQQQKQQQLQQQKLMQQLAAREKHAQQQEEIKRKQEKEQREMQEKMEQRSHWKRAQNGVFLNQKGRVGAVPHTVSAMVRCKDTAPAVQAPRLSSTEFRERVLIATTVQKVLRRRIAAGASYTATDAIELGSTVTSSVKLLDPDKFRRAKIEPKKFAKGYDRVARKSRQAVAESLIKQYKEINKSIIGYQQEFFKFHRQRKADVTKVAKAIRDSFEKEEKKKGKEEAQFEKARLAALKANDMTAYSKLLEETKNDRLKFLLDKTEKHFTQISSTLLQKRSSEDGPVTNSTSSTDPSSYYASAHMHSEEVRQPSILIGGDLKEYQLSGLQWMVSLYNNKLNGILADEMGLGKTIQAISLIAYLMEFKQNLGPFLVIVPLSTLSNWESEFSKWCPAARTVSYKGLPNQRKDIYKDHVRSGQFNVLLTTYEYIIRDKNSLRKIVWQYAIVDEGHRMKNAQSKFAVTLGTQYTTKYRILLTGTPLMNDLSELWSLLNFLLPSIFNSVTTFDQWFSAPFASFAGTTATEESTQDLLTNEERVLIIHRLHELLRPFMLRRVKSEVLDQLPEKVEKVLRCELSSWQKELYKQISKKVVDESNLLSDSDSAPSRGFNNVVMQLRKVCNHPFLFSPEGYHVNDLIIRSSGKLALLDQMLPKLKAAGHRILMFTQMTQVMTILEDYFLFRGYLSLRLDGSTPADEREKRMYRFNSPDSPYFIFLLSTRAGGLGLNLTAADTVIIFDSDWNPMQDLQAQDRAHRIGQRSDVSIFRLCSNSPVEEKILSRANEKLNVAALVIESGKFNKDSVVSDNSMERKRLMEILLTDFNQTTQSKTPANSGDSDDDGDDAASASSEKDYLNELISNNEADFQLYTKFDAEQANTVGGYKPAELFTKYEDVPDWIRYPPTGTGTSLFAAVSDNAVRKRKAVTYDDGLTEKQFMRIMDKQSVEEEQVRKKAKGKRGRKKKFVSDGGELESVSQAKNNDTVVNGNSELTDWTFRKLISCGKSVVLLKDPSTKRRLADIFLEKPDPATFPDYYEVIERPIAINDILRKCRAKQYNNFSEFKDDWKLMFSNARKFNGDGSWVVEDARALERELERVLKKNGFVDDQRPPTSKATLAPKLKIKISLKDVKSSGSGTNVL